MSRLRQPSSFRSRRRGSSMVEFALVFLVFLLMVAGTLEIGRAVWAYNTLAHAARQGARFAMIRGSQNPATADQVRTVVRNAAVGLDPNQITVTTTWPSGVARGNEVRVAVRYTMPLVTGQLLLRSAQMPLGANTRAILAN